MQKNLEFKIKTLNLTKTKISSLSFYIPICYLYYVHYKPYYVSLISV